MHVVLLGVAVALNGAAYGWRRVEQLVNLVVVVADPGHFALLQVGAADLDRLPLELIVPRTVDASVENLDHGAGIAVVMDGRVVASWPDLQNEWDARRVALVAAVSQCYGDGDEHAAIPSCSPALCEDMSHSYPW